MSPPLPHGFQEPREGRLSLWGALVDAGVLQHLSKDQAGLLFQDVQGVVPSKGVPGLQLLGPAGVFGQGLDGPGISAGDQDLRRPMTSMRPMFSFLM